MALAEHTLCEYSITELVKTVLFYSATSSNSTGNLAIERQSLKPCIIVLKPTQNVYFITFPEVSFKIVDDKLLLCLALGKRFLVDGTGRPTI